MTSGLLASNLHSKCDNPCVACQRAVYQLKFQQIADCGNSHCKNTCYKIKEQWFNSPDQVFKPFEKDVFGKCEICFRAGYCSIAECHAQQEKEMEFINSVVNKATLTASKKDLVGEMSFESFKSDPMFYDPERLHELDNEIDEAKEKINKNLDASVAKKDAKTAIKEVQKVMDKLFQKDATFSGKSVSQLKKESKPENTVEEKEKVQEFVEATDKYVKHVKKVADLKKEAGSAKESDKKKVTELVEKTKRDLEEKIKSNKKILKNVKKSKAKIIKEAVKGTIASLEKIKSQL